MESDERIAYIISRKIFVYSLETLLTEADLNVKGLRYIPPCADFEREESVEITFLNGYKKNVCIEADSRAAIIKDVLRACL